MPDSTFTVSHFLGGEISEFAQGRFDRPDYRFSMKVCLNGFPNEIGTWVRRPGTRHGGYTRSGNAARVVKFDFEQSNAVTMEFTDSFLRFRSGATLVTGNDSQVVVAVSSATPAVVQTTSAVTWSTGDTLVFPGASTPLLENRQFTATKVNTTHFQLADAITGAAIDGSTLGALASGATVARIHELATAYNGTHWSDVRSVQAETTSILLDVAIKPQALTVTTLPSDGVNPQFAIAEATFNDGPYLDAFTNGVQATPNAKSGVITLTLSFPAYDSAKAYTVGQFVTSAGINYRSLVDQNVGNSPAGSPAEWVTVDAGAAVNDGSGFLFTDIGRLVRLFSEPSAWDSTATYSAGAVVSYNPSGLPGETTYWSSLTGGNINHIPGTDLTNWQLIPQGAAMWSWGKIVGLLNTVPTNPAGIARVGNMSSGGGLAAAFNGNTSQAAASSAVGSVAGSGATSFAFSVYVGQNFSGCVTTAYAISSVTIFPSTDLGMFSLAATQSLPGANSYQIVVLATLYGSNSAPASSNNGTALGSTTLLFGTTGLVSGTTNNFLFSPVTIVSNDQTTTYKYLWIELTAQVNGTIAGGVGTFSYQASLIAGQISFVAAAGSAVSGAGVQMEVLGAALPYTNVIKTWRLGAYSDTTGWPTCGTYYEGRLWLGGAIANRFDACVSNGISGTTVNFAPTNQYGQVAASNAISYVLNSDSINKIVWMQPDLQGVIMGTLSGEYLVQAPTTGPIAPTNISARRVTRIGCADVDPRRTEHTNVFVKRYGRKLIEYFADANFNKLSGPNLADKAEHIVSAGIEEIAYSEAVTPIIWGRDGNNALFGCTYKRDTLTTAAGPTFAAWHRHELGSGRTVEGICVGPSVGGDLDTLTMVTYGSTSNTRHVEVLTDTMDETADLADAWYLDNAVSPTSTSSSTVAASGAPYGSLTINGLWHLNGKTVQVFAGGLDCGDLGSVPSWSSTKTYAQYEPVRASDGLCYVSQLGSNLNHDPTADDGTNWQRDFIVSNGSVTVPYGDSVSAGSGKGLFTADFAAGLSLSQIVVGFTFNSDGQLVKPQTQADSGARNGPAFGKLSRGHRYAVKLVGTLGISFGGSFDDLKPAIFKNSRGDTIKEPLSAFTGIHQDALQDGYDYDNALAWRISRPYPANVVAVAVNMATQDQ